MRDTTKKRQKSVVLFTSPIVYGVLEQKTTLDKKGLSLKLSI